MMVNIEFELTFHGTDSRSSSNIFHKGFNVNLSGGELGKGFYSGNSYHNAKAWAFYKSGQSLDKAKVIAVRLMYDEFLTLDINFLDDALALSIYKNIKKYNLHRSFIFNTDVMESKILGKEIENARQYKWESMSAQNILNSKNILKMEIDDKSGYGNFNILWN